MICGWPPPWHRPGPAHPLPGTRRGPGPLPVSPRISVLRAGASVVQRQDSGESSRGGHEEETPVRPMGGASARAQQAARPSDRLPTPPGLGHGWSRRPALTELCRLRHPKESPHVSRRLQFCSGRPPRSLASRSPGPGHRRAAPCLWVCQLSTFPRDGLGLASLPSSRPGVVGPCLPQCGCHPFAVPSSAEGPRALHLKPHWTRPVHPDHARLRQR